MSVALGTAADVILNYAAVGIFAATGALAAARRVYDLSTFVLFAMAVGLVGGAVRDVLLSAPVFFILDPAYVAVCIVAAGAIWTLGVKIWPPQTLLWLDAAGLALYAVEGAQKAAASGVAPLGAAALGVAAAVVPGLVRDTLAGEAALPLRRDLYVAAAILGAAGYVILRLLGLDAAWSAGVSGLGAFIARGCALRWGLTLARSTDPDA